jgi:hypothetical protein
VFQRPNPNRQDAKHHSGKPTGRPTSKLTKQWRGPSYLAHARSRRTSRRRRWQRRRAEMAPTVDSQELSSLELMCTLELMYLHIICVFPKIMSVYLNTHILNWLCPCTKDTSPKQASNSDVRLHQQI